MTAIALVDITFHSAPSNLQEVRDRVRESCVRVGCAEELGRKLVLVIDEAVSNVMRHAYQGERDREIRLRISQEDERIIFQLRDYADPVDVSCIRPRDLSECRPGGLGINFNSSSVVSDARLIVALVTIEEAPEEVGFCELRIDFDRTRYISNGCLQVTKCTVRQTA